MATAVRSNGSSWRRLGALLLILTGSGALFAGLLQAQAVTYHVSTSGSDANPGTQLAPFQTVQKAVDVVRPGDTILVHKGTYEGTIEIWRRGEPDKPITLRSAGDGLVTLTATFPDEPCTSTAPTGGRTVQIREGRDYWIIRNLTIINGIRMEGTNLDALAPYTSDHTLPGRGLYDPASARWTLESLGSDGADHIQILYNKIKYRGLWGRATRYGRFIGNTISDIKCGTGGGIWLARFSDGWLIRGNTILNIAASSTHPMTEGIRITTGSMYGTIEKNKVTNVEGVGRGISADENAGWNVYRNNRVENASIGFSEQFGSWGNTWTYNVAVNNRRYGFRVGPSKSTPTDDTPRFLTMKCNQDSNAPFALSIGSATESTWDSNNFATVELKLFRSYWPKSGNLWDGSSAAPPTNPSTSRFFSNC